MQIDGGDLDGIEWRQERLAEYVHPAGQDDQVRLVLKHQLRQVGIVPGPAFLQLGLVLFTLLGVPAGDKVEVFGRDAVIRRSRRSVRIFSVHDDLDNATLWDLAALDGVDDSLQIAAITGAEHSQPTHWRIRVGSHRTVSAGWLAFYCERFEVILSESPPGHVRRIERRGNFSQARSAGDTDGTRLASTSSAGL